ncbi:hypothetical protein LINGRAHAP2_LOCUS18011 [Linum grandiflorum]
MLLSSVAKDENNQMFPIAWQWWKVRIVIHGPGLLSF